ncbi:MAG TPA: hypothetical protein VEY30_05180, partial [Myxococcaceae bacterium]|nr:hypothetical protein [Myxococcaceae bacterium]
SAAVDGASMAAVAVWEATLPPGTYDAYAYVSPQPGHTQRAVYCVVWSRQGGVECAEVNQAEGEARWVWLKTFEATERVEVALDPAASPSDGRRVSADAVAFVPTRP